tara:strand:+ start:484 stop:1047 length:564 start_codon:yes stop_codon:yes gene_type:complete
MIINILKNKKEERRKFKEIRKKDSKYEKTKVRKNVELFLSSLDQYKLKNKNLAIYWPLKYEIDLRGLKSKYSLALPRCTTNHNLEFHLWNDSPLKNDINGIPYPNNKILLSYKQISHIFVPCLSIDKNFNRLGYGGGYFDKLRSPEHWRLVPCIGILTERCVSKNSLTKAEWDIPLSGFITDKDIFI